MKKTLLFLAVISASFSFAQVTVGSGTAVDSNAGLSTPVSNYYGYSLSQAIYLASEINAAGDISSLSFELNSAGAITNSDDNIDVWIGHTTRTSFAPTVSATGADWIPVSAQTQVMTNGSLVRSGNIVTITFTQPFAYNGTDNLVVTVDANEPNYDSNSVLYLQGAATNDKMSLMIRNDAAASNPDPMNMPLNYTGTTTATSVQAKNTRAKITFTGLTVLGTAENNAQSIVTIYPNPAGAQLFFTGSNIVSAEIYSAVGQLVHSVKVLNNEMEVDVLAAGVYFVKATNDSGQVITKKFIKG